MIINNMRNFDIKYIVIFGEDKTENYFNTKIITNNIKDIFVTDFTTIKEFINFFTLFEADLLLVNKSTYKKYYYIIKELKYDLPIILIDNTFQDKFYTTLPTINNCILLRDIELIKELMKGD